MMKKHAMESMVFWVVCLVVLALVGGDVSAQAEVYRASVAPRPAADSGKTALSQTASEKAKTSAAKGGAAQKKSSVAKSTGSSKPAASSAVKTSTKKAARQTASAPAKKSVQPSKAAKKSATSTSKTAQKKTSAKTSARSAQKKVSAKSKASSKSKRSAAKSSRKSTPAVAPQSRGELHLNAKSALLINMSNGKIYFEQNPDKAIAPASITKLLTLYLVREAMAQGRLGASTPIPVSSQAVRTGGSSMSLRRGERVPLNELIKGISVVSANNACVAIAEYLGKGDSNRFVSQMNAKAKALGMTQSRFRNPNGLPASGQLSTARDIAKLSMAYLRTFPESLSVHSMTTHTYHGATHRNANSLLRTYRGVDGLKTGFVCASGYNITATAKRGNTRLLAVVLGTQSSTVRQIETARLLDYGFKRAAAEQGDATLARN